MSIRGDNMRRHIIGVSSSLFADKGFSSVTMQDICDACGISRGGLYRHYGSVAEVFSAIIADEQARAFAALDDARQSGISAKDMLLTFLTGRMHALLENGGVDNAVSEFAAESEKNREIIVLRAEHSIDIVAEMIRIGCDEGAFVCEDARATALNIMCLLEGLNKHNSLIPLTKEQVNKQLELIYRLIK